MRVGKVFAKIGGAVALLAPLAAMAGPLTDGTPLPEPLTKPQIDDPALRPGAEVNIYRTGMEAVERGNLAEAARIFESLREKSPHSAAPYIGLAEVAVKKGDLKTAQSHLSAGIAAAPKVSELYRAQARLYKIQRQYAAAVSAFQKSIELAPKDARPRVELANLLAGVMNQPEKSLVYYRAATSLDSKDPAVPYGLGYAYMMLKRDELAIASFREAQRLAEKNPTPSLMIAQVHARAKRNAEALGALDAALKIDPNFALGHVARGDLLQRMGRGKESPAEYRAALKSDPNQVNALVGLGMAQQGAGENDGAIDSYKKAVALDGNQALALNNLAWLSSQRKTVPDDALTWARKAVALAPDRAEFHDTLGWVLRQRGELAEASKELERAVQLGPSAVGYTHLAELRAAMGRKEAAAEAYRQALKLSPNFAPAREGLKALN